jgi:hypothetical protein
MQGAAQDPLDLVDGLAELAVVAKQAAGTW